MYTKPFTSLSKNDIAIAGGKGASLGELTQAGVTVPPGCVVLTAAFDRFCTEKNITAQINEVVSKTRPDDITSVQLASEKIHALMLDAVMPAEIAEEIEHAFELLDTPLVAVRSSATAEDSSIASWAGELESFLNIDRSLLLDAVKRCWASLFTPRAIFYRYEKHLADANVSVAVVIQTMVQSEVSGICFTVHPVTEDPHQMVIEAGYGLGEAIVGGMITPDTYIIEKSTGKNKNAKIIDKNISEQSMMIVQGKSGSVRQKVPKKIMTRQKLSDNEIMDLARVCMHIEDHYRQPQDIEWAYHDNQFYILQSRPITTLRPISTAGGH